MMDLKIANFSVGLIAFLLLAVTISPSALGASITSCGSPASGIHTIDNDISSTNNCFSVLNDTVIDGQGYDVYINCTGVISIEDPPNNITLRNINFIKNGTCTGTSAGFFIGEAQDIIIDNVTISSTVNGDNTHFDGLRICSLDLIIAGNNCTNFTYSDITYKGNGTGIIIGNTNVTYTDINIQDVNLTTTTAYDSVFSANAIFIGQSLAGSFLIQNATLSSENSKQCLWIANSNVIANEINCVAGLNGLQLNANNITLNDATVTSAGNAITTASSANNVSIYNTNLNSTGGHGISVQSSSSDVTIENATITSDTLHGINIHTATNVDIDNVTIIGNNQTTGEGIKAVFSSNIDINDFFIQYYARGIMIYGSSGYDEIENGEIYDINLTGTLGHGVFFYESNNSRIENVIINNTGSGCFGYFGNTKPSENHVAINITSSNAGHGSGDFGSIFLIGAKNITVSESTLTDSTYGIWLSNFLTYYNQVNDTWFYNNTISSNTNNIEINVTHTNTNFNDSSYGNIWSDYAGCDCDIFCTYQED